MARIFHGSDTIIEGQYLGRGGTKNTLHPQLDSNNRQCALLGP